MLAPISFLNGRLAVSSKQLSSLSPNDLVLQDEVKLAFGRILFESAVLYVLLQRVDSLHR